MKHTSSQWEQNVKRLLIGTMKLTIMFINYLGIMTFMRYFFALIPLLFLVVVFAEKNAPNYWSIFPIIISIVIFQILKMPAYKEKVFFKVKKVLKKYKQYIEDYDILRKTQKVKKKKDLITVGRVMTYEQYVISKKILKKMGYLETEKEFKKEVTDYKTKEALYNYFENFQKAIEKIEAKVKKELSEKVVNNTPKLQRDWELEAAREEGRKEERMIAEQEKQIREAQYEKEKKQLIRKRELPFDEVAEETEQKELAQSYSGEDDVNERRRIRRYHEKEKQLEYMQWGFSLMVREKELAIEKYLLEQFTELQARELAVEEQVVMLRIQRKELDVVEQMIDLREYAVEVNAKVKDFELAQKLADFEHDMRLRENTIAAKLIDLKNIDSNLREREAALRLDKKAIGVERKRTALQKEFVALDKYRNELYQQQYAIAASRREQKLQLGKDLLKIQHAGLRNESRRALNQVNSYQNNIDYMLRKIGLEKQGLQNFFHEQLNNINHQTNKQQLLHERNSMLRTLMQKDYQMHQQNNLHAQQNINWKLKLDASDRQSYAQVQKLMGKIDILQAANRRKY